MKKYSYRNFGHIPSYSIKTNLLSFLFGVPNLFKRFQSKTILEVIAVQKNEKILDFGCGSGYLTVELFRAGGKICGLDINRMPTHNALKDCYDVDIAIVSSGIKSPYESNSFDKIIVSEVLSMIPNPQDFLIELNRILKRDGELFIINGFGHTRIKRMYEQKSLLYFILKILFKDRFPQTYKDYTNSLNRSFATAQKDFLTIESVQASLEALNFKIIEIVPLMKESTSNGISIIQFLYYIITNNGVFKSGHFYILYPLLKCLNLISRKKMCDNHLLIKCKNNDVD